MIPVKLDIDPDNPDADGLAAANDSSGTTLTLDGALISGGTFTASDGLGHKIDITDTATVDQSGATFTINGTNANDQSISEDVTGPGSGATVTSSKYFKTVTSITIASGAGSGTANVGTNDEVASQAIPLNWRSNYGCMTAIAGASGTFSVDIQETFDDCLSSEVDNANWIDKHVSLSGDGGFELDVRARGVRAHTNSFTNGAEFQFHIVQSNG
ncbi:MAG: hypothetical protein GWN13_01795, partial [Phycisphaerae bacterium]|nr:hypothetical protein [Phycisphaerae bacterium]